MRPPNNRRRISRRQFLLGAAGALLAGCLPRTTDQQAAPGPAATAAPAEAFTPVVPAAATAAPAVAPTPTQAPINVGPGTAAAAYDLPLVVRHVGPGRASFFFSLTAASPGALLLTPEEGSPQLSVPLDAAQARHLISVEGLPPGTAFRAELGLGPALDALNAPAYEGGPWGAVRFRTQAQTPAALRFAAFGDSGFGDERTYRLAEQIAARGPDFTLHLGDCVYWAYDHDSPRDAWAAKWFKPLAPLLRSGPVYAVPGNHDYDADARDDAGLAYYYTAQPPITDTLIGPSDRAGLNQFYALSYGDVQFILLDSQTFFGVEGRAEQESWLAERLADPRFRLNVPVHHVPAFSSGEHGDSDSWPVRRGWGPLFTPANRVGLAVAAHDHNYERLLVEGTTFIISGGGSATLYAPDIFLEQSQFFQSVTHYTWFELEGSHLRIEAVNLDGAVIDQAELTV